MMINPAIRSYQRLRSNTTILIVLTLVTGGLFKVSAFARESFIAAFFGLSETTDAYFGLQQLPLATATFMFGAFALAFVPAYAEAFRRYQTVSWLRGLLVCSCFVGLLLTCLMLVCSPLLLHLFAPTANRTTWNTLLILSLCFVPVVCIGIWAGICTSQGSNLWAMSMTGLPYLVMTLTLVALYAAKALNNLSLPISMAIGFGIVGLYSLTRILGCQSRENVGVPVISMWKVHEFRVFIKQLLASSSENGGYAANQLLIVYFLARCGTGAISANNCAMRVGLLGFSLVAQPLAQLMQARLCACDSQKRQATLIKWLSIVGTAVLGLTMLLFMLRVPLIRAVYMHGKFQTTQLNQVSNSLPPWIGYFIVISLNAIVARYLFTSSKGSTYVRHQLGAYAAANALRFSYGGALTAPGIIWCSVATEGIALLLNIRSCFAEPRPATERVSATPASEIA